MKQTNKNKPLWKKHSRGALYLANNPRHRIKPNQKVRATEDELGKWKDDFTLVENGKGEYTIDTTDVKPNQPKKESVPKVVKEEYTIDSVGAGWYNVISPAGVRMNDKSLRAVDAKALKEQLEEDSSNEE